MKKYWLVGALVFCAALVWNVNRSTGVQDGRETVEQRPTVPSQNVDPSPEPIRYETPGTVQVVEESLIDEIPETLFDIPLGAEIDESTSEPTLESMLAELDDLVEELDPEDREAARRELELILREEFDSSGEQSE